MVTLFYRQQSATDSTQTIPGQNKQARKLYAETDEAIRDFGRIVKEQAGIKLFKDSFYD